VAGVILTALQLLAFLLAPPLLLTFQRPRLADGEHIGRIDQVGVDVRGRHRVRFAAQMQNRRIGAHASGKSQAGNQRLREPAAEPRALHAIPCS
jgi:hypothetical protein